MIKILKASAGSGKTWNLARQYIRLLLEKRDAFSYRHILAVTFTNKATDEMKDRILMELHKLATSPCKSDYYADFVPSVFPDAESLSEAAGSLLCNILHDYSAFAISTIDRFFQQTLKSFAREIGQFSSYSIELDKGSLVKESVDRLLDSLTEAREHSRSLEWMTRKTMSQLEQGEGYKLDYTLKKIADRFNSEEFRVAVEGAGIDERSLYSDDRLQMLEGGCEKIMKDYVAEVSAAAEYVFRCFVDAGIDPDDTTRHFMNSNLKKYLALEAGSPVPAPTESFRRNAMDVSCWFPKAKKYLEGSVTVELEEAVAAFFSHFDMEYKVYNTAMMLRNQVYGFAVANDLYEGFKAILKEKNVLTIDQTNKILRNIIDGSDTPFIYEKLGVRYDHFLLDEFQDTSLVQWDNFRPLLENSVAGGNDNLIVGDVKQSIYRWRQSDWDLLENQVSASFPDSTDVSSLDTNYRSCEEVVNFNNSYFEAAAEYLDRRFGKGEVVSAIYSDVEQKVNKKGHGMVDVRFCSEEEYYDNILASVRGAVGKGYRLGDITVLVRLNKEGGKIAQFLISNGIPVVSDDSLRISSSLTVRRLVSLLAGIDNPEDSMARHLADSLGVAVPTKWHSLVDLCEEILRRLSEVDKASFDSETLYIQSFMDLLLDYVATEGNSLRGFLKKWAEDKSNISSPKSHDAVRIMTVHKSKGLDFPYVIFPSLDSVEFYSFTDRWSQPDVEGTGLEDVADGVYDVCLSGKSVDTLFESRYKEEQLMQYVDNINILYVAYTRASHAMTIISRMPSGVELTDDGYSGDPETFTGFAQWTFAYLASQGNKLGFERSADEESGSVSFVKGELPDIAHKEERMADVMATSFCSWPLNPSVDLDSETEVCERGRLKFSADALDFFSQDGETGVEASNRIKGVVLHDILSRVIVPADLEKSVRQSVLNGELTESQAEEACELLSMRISEVSDRGWFPNQGAVVYNETELIDTDGSIKRPDRVVVSDDEVVIVDYKFGEPDPRYASQVRRYADIWRRMGYGRISAMLWYVHTGEVVEVV